VLSVPPLLFPVDQNAGSTRIDEFNPRAGLKWDLGALRSLRAAYQRWRRPASVGTLAPVETVGVALNDRLVTAGGLYQRARLQYDGEIDASTFLRAFADTESIDNGLGGRRTPITDFELTQLENLRNRPDVFSARSERRNSRRARRAPWACR
jgi:hypothetical protein